MCMLFEYLPFTTDGFHNDFHAFIPHFQRIYLIYPSGRIAGFDAKSKSRCHSLVFRF